MRFWLWFPAKDRLWFKARPVQLAHQFLASVLSPIWAMEHSRWGPQRFKRFCPPLQCSGGGLNPCTRFRSPASGRSCHRANYDVPFALEEALWKAPCAAYRSKDPHGVKSFQSPPADESPRSLPFYAGNEDTAADRCARPSRSHPAISSMEVLPEAVVEESVCPLAPPQGGVFGIQGVRRRADLRAVPASPAPRHQDRHGNLDPWLEARCAFA